MEHIEAGKFIRQALSQTIRSVGLYPAGIGDKADDAGIANTVTSVLSG